MSRPKNPSCNRRRRHCAYSTAALIPGVLLLLGVFLFAAPGLADPGSAPVIRTDKADYGPGETALITGSGFAPSETVTLQVTHTSPVATPGAGNDPWPVTADPTGHFTSTWFVNPDDSRGAAFLLAAAGTTSGWHTEATFTYASAPLSITLTSQETFWLDANKCNAQSPRGTWLSFVITNTSSTTTLTNVTADFSGFTGTNAMILPIF